MHLKGAVEASAAMLTSLSQQLKEHIMSVLTRIPLDKPSQPLSIVRTVSAELRGTCRLSRRSEPTLS